MKNLEFNQMEQITGGAIWNSCAGAAVGGSLYVAAGVGFLLSSNPVGWLALGIWAVAGAAASLSAADCAIESVESAR